MTRINLVPPSILSDKHLMAEYRELPRVFTRVKKYIAKGKTPDDFKIPSKFKLGEGHERFFHDKCSWLFLRYSDLITECRIRKFKIDMEMCTEILRSARLEIGDTEWWGMLDATPEEIYLSMARLVKRSKMPEVLNELESED